MTPRWLITHFVVILAVFVLANFGFWQLDRLEQKRTRNENITAALNQPPILLDGRPIDADALHFRQVQVAGVFDNEAGIIIRNQRFDNASGFHLVTPLLIEGSDKAVLVNRGWIRRGNVDLPPEERRIYDVTGPQILEGIAYRSQTRPNRYAPLDRPLQAGQTRLDAWFRIDIARVQEQVPYELMPIFIEQTPPTGMPVVENMPRQQGSIQLDEGPHLGYAIQWFSFSGLLALTYVLFLRISLKEDDL